MEVTEDNVVRGVVNTLNEGTRSLDPAVASRLYDLRREAVRRVSAHHVGGGVLAWAQDHRWAPALLFSGLLVAAWFVLMRSPTPASVPDNTIDVLLLTDAVPPQAFADWSLVTRESITGPVCFDQR